MMALLRKAYAFILRDFRIESGYKASFVMRVVESMTLLVFFYFLSGLITSHSSPMLGRYGNRYFPFVIIGFSFARYFDLTLRMFSDSIRLAQVTGCLEAMLSSQTGCVPLVLMSSLYSLISGAVQLLVILVAAVCLFGVDLSRMNVAATLLVVVLSITTFVAFGVLSAAAIVWLKKGDPITWILGSFGSIIGGAYFPVDLMPVWMQKIALLIPISYSLDALRLTMLSGYSVLMVAKPLMELTAIAAVLLPTSVALFAAAVRKGRKEGTLMQY
ncbi:MAG: ABC transporter permease [Bryobacteraceae bacterium]|jgi:ABC-2 type transport system permease protein